MGFGLICAGLTTLVFLRYIPAELIGFIVVARGLKKLSGYNKYFGYTLIYSYILTAFSALDAVRFALDKIPATKALLPAGTNAAFEYAHELLMLPFYILLFVSIIVICRDLDFPKGIKRARFAMAVVTVYYTVFALSMLSIPKIGFYIFAAKIIFFLINLLITILTVYTCYMYITTDEAEAREEEKLRKFDERFGKKKKNDGGSASAAKHAAGKKKK